jgi:predicted protein tyrosine phosphatase
MPWIQNVAMSDIKKGFHINPGDNAMLIQIVDCGSEFPTPLYNFKEVHQFEFLDVEEKDFVLEEEMRCSHEQAKQLTELLLKAYAQRMNVIVHCHAGVCRSGAVCEVGVMLGFDDTEVFRAPNLLVKHRMMKALGWGYDENEAPTINGQPYNYSMGGIILPPGHEGDL